MMPTMTREQFESMTLEELIDWAYENIDYVHTEGGLIGMAKHEIDEENLQMAVHILKAVCESNCLAASYYFYDRSMGTLETPTPITCKEDLEDYIDFEEDEETAESLAESYAEEWAWRQEGCFAENEEEETEND